MLRHAWQALVATIIWSMVLAYAGVPVALAVLIPTDVALFGLAFIRWRSVPT